MLKVVLQCFSITILCLVGETPKCLFPIMQLIGAVHVAFPTC